MKRFITLTIICLSVMAIGTYADDFYYGGMTNQVLRFNKIADNAQNEADSIQQALGFNLLFGCGAVDSELVKLGTEQGFYTFPSMNRTQSAGNDYWALRNANYAKIEAEDTDHAIRFTNQAGAGDTAGIYYAPLEDTSQAAIFLSGLSYRHWLNINTSESRLDYVLQVKIYPDSSIYEISEGQQIGFLLVNGDTLISISYDPDSTGVRVFDLIERKYPAGESDYVEIGTYQRCIFGVDWFKVYNGLGERLVEQHIFSEDVLDFAESYTDSGNVVYWYFHDEPRYTQWLPDSVWRYEFNNYQGGYHGASVFSHNVGQKLPREYVEYGDPEILFCDIYPLKGGQICSTFTTIIAYETGDTLASGVDEIRGNRTAYTGYDSTSAGWGLQKVIDDYYVDYLDTLYAVAEDNGRDFWVLSQAFKQGFKDYEDSTEYVVDDSGDTLSIIIRDRDCEDDVGFIWRLPTRSELSALTFIAMCYPIKGLVYWRYDSVGGDEVLSTAEGITEYDEDGDWIKGILWGFLEDYISPYVKAYGDLYASETLIFDRTYKTNDSTDPPSAALVETIDYWSESTNPDSGWFQVGEFHDASAKYVMLVNRACNVDRSTLAPDMNVIVHFDTAAFDSDYLYVINLADTAYYDPVSPGGWQAIPDTTYTAALNGTIPFTTVLGPGEGRLFKIVGTDRQ
jgi:hypothetical protein